MPKPGNEQLVLVVSALPAAASRIESALSDAKINFESGGSRLYGFWVKQADVRQAVKAVDSDSRLYGYSVTWGSIG